MVPYFISVHLHSDFSFTGDHHQPLHLKLLLCSPLWLSPVPSSFSLLDFSLSNLLYILTNIIFVVNLLECYLPETRIYACFFKAVSIVPRTMAYLVNWHWIPIKEHNIREDLKLESSQNGWRSHSAVGWSKCSWEYYVSTSFKNILFSITKSLYLLNTCDVTCIQCTVIKPN